MRGVMSIHTWQHDRSLTLASASWQAAEGEDVWALLLRVLVASTRKPSALEPTTGRLNVYRPDGEPRAPELWPLDADAAGIDDLRRRVVAALERGASWLPSEVVLRTRIRVLLPEDATGIDLADWETDEERAGAMPLVIHTDDDGPPAPPGKRAWRIAPDEARFEEHSPVYVRVLCWADDAPPTVSLSVESMLDLWQERSFDGREDVPCSSENVALLREAVAALAQRTGGTVSRH
jgi:hypothetical protein